MKFQSTAVYALAAIAAITGTTEARLGSGRRLWDDFHRPPHTRPQRPTGESIMNSIMWDQGDENIGFGDDFHRPPHTRPHRPTGESIMNSIMWDQGDESAGGWNGCKFEECLQVRRI